MPEKQQLNDFEPVVGDVVEIPSKDLTLGGRTVTVKPMTMQSLENLVVVLAEPLQVLAEELISQWGGGSAPADGMLSVIGDLWQKHVVNALVGAPKLLRQSVSVMINLDADSPIVGVASLSEMWACWEKLAGLNDFVAIGQQIAGLFRELMTQYGQQALTQQQAETSAEDGTEVQPESQTVLELVQPEPIREVQQEPAE